MTRPKWKIALDPYEAIYSRMYSEIVELVMALSVADQIALLYAASMPAILHFGWTLYEAADLIRFALPNRDVLEERLIWAETRG